MLFPPSTTNAATASRTTQGRPRGSTPPSVSISQEAGVVVVHAALQEDMGDQGVERLGVYALLDIRDGHADSS
jgi:hypothetical protein